MSFHAVASIRDRLDGRIARIRKELSNRQVDALVVSDLSNLYYLTRLRLSAGLLVIGPGDTNLNLVIDFRYETAVRELIEARCTPHELSLVPVDPTYEETLVELTNTLGVRRLGIESDHTSVRRWQWLEKGIAAVLVPISELIEKQRMVKEPAEIGVLREAGELLASAVPVVAKFIREGRTELDVARDINRLICQIGFERPSFETIVASGPNSALPHAHPTARSITRGDLVILDFGGILDGYCVDMSRTVAVGWFTEENKRLYQAVSEAQLEALAVAIPGAAASAVDAAARRVLAKHNLADAFRHSTGHGIGIDVHELPRIGRVDVRSDGAIGDVSLAPGMVFTIEPGVYIPKRGGVRIEDDVVVTKSGIEVLTPASRELLVT